MTKNRRTRKSKDRASRPVEHEVPVRTRPHSGFNTWLYQHTSVARNTLGQLLAAPLSSLLSAAVIAIALALPSGLMVMLRDSQQLVGQWQDTAQISVFLKQGIDNDNAQRLARTISQWPNVRLVSYMSADDALAEFQQNSGFGDVLAVLQENPLPAVIIVEPEHEDLSRQSLAPLVSRLQDLSQVDTVQVDFEWIQRLNQIIRVAQRGGLLLSLLLGVAVLLVVGNTIRLTIFNRRQEILVVKLIGGTPGFIRRPFLYTGFWYGLMGAVIAWILVSGFFLLMNEPMRQLLTLYNSNFELTGLTLRETGLMFLVGVGLGLIGSWLAVSRHIHTIEPS